MGIDPSEIEQLLQRAEALADAHARQTARDLVIAVLKFHAEALSRLLTLLRARADGAELVARLSEDELVKSLLLLHDLEGAAESRTASPPEALVPVERLTRAARRTSCALCGAAVESGHRHVLERGTQRLECACEPCAAAFASASGGRYLTVGRSVCALGALNLDAELWASLGIPVGLAFFRHSSETGRVVAAYPGAAGAAEAEVDGVAWRALVEQNPVLSELESDVEALLVNRLGAEPEYYRVPIDECYRLVGSVRQEWRGISGGEHARRAIADFFASLKQALP